MDIKIKPLFPTLIGQFNDSTFVDKVTPLASQLLQTNSKKWGYKNTFNDKESHNIINSNLYIKEYILNLGHQYLLQIGYKPQFLLDSFIFFSHMEKNDYHNPHLHDGSLLSGVVYLEVPSNSSPIIFYDPREIKNFNGLIKLPNTPINQTNIPFIPKKDDILIWESWITHEVPPNNSDSRKTLVFNIFYKK